MTPAVTIRNLSLAIKGKKLLDELSLTLTSGAIHLILGPNGAGKTLLLRCIAGVLQPSAGTVSRLPLSWTPLSSDLPFAFTVRDLVIMGRYPTHKGFPGVTDRKRADAALQRLGMLEFAERSYNSLSRGEQTRADIARAIAADAPLLVLDEPFANLDIDASLSIMQLFHELRQEGRTLVLSHHDLYSARELGTDLVFLKKGRLVAAGPCADLFTAAWIRETYGVDARIHSDASGAVFIRFEKGPRST